MDYFGRLGNYRPVTIYLGFNPSGLMDYFGSSETISKSEIPMGFNPSGLMDYFGSSYCACSCSGELRFNPSGLMDYFGRIAAPNAPIYTAKFQSFWVNGLLWKVPKLKKTLERLCLFQSFWVNGLLWKKLIFWVMLELQNVSILLGQWITLEGCQGTLHQAG